MRILFKRDGGARVKPVQAEPPKDVKFIAAGVQAAKHTRNGTRTKVLNDLADTLRCEPRALRFLFSDLAPSQDPYDFDFPDSARRRQVIALNGWDVAE